MSDATPPPSNKVTLKIDGQSVTVDKGTNVLEAAKDIGCEISHFCYHPGLSSPAVCRQCLVEVKGQGKLQPSCYFPVAEGMEVVTNSPRVLDVRRQMLEFTLANHPVDCPICDKAGECTLQKHYVDWDHSPSRIEQGKQRKPKVVDLGPTIVLDAERCILCTRCIRVCDEVAGQHQLEMAHRGDREQITTAPGHQLDNPYSVNTVDVCPVGALTQKDFRFEMRVWELSATNSICNGCSTGCNVELHTAQGHVHRTVPRENQAINKFWMCDEGRETYHALYADRIAGARLQGERTSLDRAVHFAAERLKTLIDDGKASRIALVLSPETTNEDNYAVLKVARALGIEKVFVGGKAPVPEREDKILRKADVNPNMAGIRAITGGKAKGAAQLSAALVAHELSALWVMGPTVELDEEALATLKNLELVIFQSTHETIISKDAHVVLPAAAWAEVNGTFTNFQGVVQRIRQAVDAPGEALPHYAIASRLAKKLAVAAEWAMARTVFAEMKSNVEGWADAQFGRDLPTVQLRFAGGRG